MKLLVLMAVFLVLICRKNNFIKCVTNYGGGNTEQRHNNNNDDDNPDNNKDKFLTYRLVKFDPSAIVKGSDTVKQVTEETEDDVNYDDENRNNAENEEENPEEEEEEQEGEEEQNDGGVEGGGGGEEEDQNELTTEKFQPNILPKRNHKHSEIISTDEAPESDPASADNEQKRSSLYKSVILSQKSNYPYNFQLPDDFEREFKKFQTGRRIPVRIISKRTASRDDIINDTVDSVDKHIENYFQKRERENKSRDSSRSRSRSRKSKSRRKPRDNNHNKSIPKYAPKRAKGPVIKDSKNGSQILEQQEQSMPGINPIYEAGEATPHEKGITARDINLRIRSQKPVPLFVRHFKTYWPSSYSPQHIMTAQANLPVSPMPSQPRRPGFNYPIINHKHIHQHGVKQDAKKSCKNECKKKKKRRKPKIKKSRFFHRQRLACSQKHPEFVESAPDGQIMYNYQQHDPPPEYNSIQSQVFDAGTTATQQMYPFRGADDYMPPPTTHFDEPYYMPPPTTDFDEPYYNPDPIPTVYNSEESIPSIQGDDSAPVIHEGYFPSSDPTTNDQHENMENLEATQQHPEELDRDLDQPPPELPEDDDESADNEDNEEYVEEDGEETKTRKASVTTSDKGKSKNKVLHI